MEKISQISPKPVLCESKTFIAEVVDVENGMAICVSTGGNELFYVKGHGSMVPVLNVGDQVIAITVSEGCIITDRVREENETPTIANHNGQLIFESKDFIGLKVKDCYIRMDKRGDLVTHANSIRSLAEAINEIQGELVKLN